MVSISVDLTVRIYLIHRIMCYHYENLYKFLYKNYSRVSLKLAMNERTKLLSARRLDAFLTLKYLSKWNFVTLMP